MHDLTFRRGCSEDLALISQFNCAMAKETERKELDPGVVLVGSRAVLEDAAKGFYLLAETTATPGPAGTPQSPPKVVGQLLVTFEWSDWRGGNFWWIQSVYVVPGARRRGVYRGLYAHLLDEAKQRPDVCGVRLYVDKGNVTAQSTYEALGMERAHYELYEIDFVL